MTHPLRVAENCTTHPLHKAQNLMTHPLSAPAHPLLYFLTSPLLNFLKCFQDYCGRSSGSRKDPKNIHPAFLSLAKSTSGQAILFNNLEEMERLSSWTIETMQGYVIVTSGSNKKRREGRGIGSTDGWYTIPVDDSVEKMFVTINTAVEGTMGSVGLLVVIEASFKY